MLLKLLILLIFLINTIKCANILISPSGLFPVHRYTMKYLAEELLKRGHKVTWFEIGLKKPDIPLPKDIEEIYMEVTPKNSLIRDLYEYKNHSFYSKIWTEDENDKSHQYNAWLASIDICDEFLSNYKSKNIFDNLVNRKFDSVIIDDLYNPCGLIHTGLQKSVYIYWSMTGLRTESAWANQSPSPPSYIPVYGTGLTDELNFFERGYNFLSYIQELYIHQHIILRRIDKLGLKYYPNKLSTAFDMERNASINFINHPPIFDFARPYMPRVNFVGGLHCKNSTKLKELSPTLKKFIDTSNNENGFILLTTGFTFEWISAPKNIKENLIEAFRELKNINFVWQYNGEPIKNLPKNVYISSWLPQQKLLGHEKCKGHITHGGLNSVIESVYHGVPVIGWPLTIWGKDNLLRVTSRHCGIMLDTKNPTKQDWISVINRIYINFYKEEMLLFQDMVIDVPYTELNHSAFWVEFVVRHQEVPHSRSGADQLNIIQYFLIDVIIFLLSMTIITCYTVFVLMRFTIKSIFFLITYPIRNIINKFNDNTPRPLGPKATATTTATTKTKTAGKNKQNKKNQ